MTVQTATTDPRVAAAQDAVRERAGRWHDQMRAAEYGYCPKPVNREPFDMYDVYSATITGNEFLRVELARAAGHVFVAGETDEQAWCVRCDHPARVWPEARVFIAGGTPCPSDVRTGAEA
uniref:hypothetical protein n=1 Tax=Amycolatopsis sp. CA-151526 TaxID=3239921 RepID=UPI003F49A00A